MPERPLAVVTGASSGIGAEFARQLARRGYSLLLVARREDRLQALAAELGVPTEVMAADLSMEPEWERLAERIRREPRLHLLVNNAGFGTLGMFAETELEAQRRMHRLHVMAALTLTHAALANLTSRISGDGHAFPGAPSGVINVASIASFGQAPSNVSYCATKAWMASFTEGLAMELQSKGSPVQVQALCPGFTYSEFHDVLKMDRRAVPKLFWLTAEFVVRESLNGFDRCKLFVIPGWRYRVIAGFMKWTPKPLLRAISIRMARYRQARVQR